MIWQIAAMQADAVQRLTSTAARTGRYTGAFYLWFLIIGWSN